MFPSNYSSNRGFIPKYLKYFHKIFEKDTGVYSY